MQAALFPKEGARNEVLRKMLEDRPPGLGRSSGIRDVELIRPKSE